MDIIIDDQTLERFREERSEHDKELGREFGHDCGCKVSYAQLRAVGTDNYDDFGGFHHFIQDLLFENRDDDLTYGDEGAFIEGVIEGMTELWETLEVELQ